MLFENCTYHLGQEKKIIVEDQITVKLVCRECFQSGSSENKQFGVILCDGTMRYFSQWNHYLVDQLRSLLEIVKEQGTQFLIKKVVPIKQQENSQHVSNKATIEYETKHILSYVISQHINLLTFNLSFMSQPMNFSQLISNPQYLSDLFTITAKTVQQILDPIKKQFQAILKKQYSLEECHMEWNDEVINVIGNIRQQILMDWAKDYVLQKTVSAQKIQKTQSEQSNQIQTQHSIDHSQSSCVSLSFDDDIDKINLSQYGEFEIGSQDNEIIDRTQSYVIDTKKENQMLLRLLSTKQEEIQTLNKKLVQSEQKCQQWMNKYQDLENVYKTTLQVRIPQIQNEFNILQDQMIIVMRDNDYYLSTVQKLQLELKQVMKQNYDLNLQQFSGYYINPYHQKQKTDQKLFTQIIQLQSQNMLKSDDIKTLINCLKFTRQNICQQSKVNYQNKNIEWTNKWQKQIVNKLKSLQTITVDQL